MEVSDKKTLTLWIDARLVEYAKEYAAANNTSVSALVESYLHSLIQQEDAKRAPVLQSLMGILPSDADWEEARYQYLLEKYGR